ncbi:MAG: hypothetical protein WCG05_05420 [Alphaproteobacteria bacterium]
MEKDSKIIPNYLVYGLGIPVVRQIAKDVAVDCDVYPGLAMAALHQGIKKVVFRGDTKYRQALQSLAEQVGAKVLFKEKT